MSESRQLLAIMFTDVVGYTALTERDEAAAVRAREQHRDLVRTLVKQFDGEVIDATGDESLAIFSSALRAVDCALALQGALRSYPDLRVRVGIHLGDVLRRDGEVVGEGVNVAARVRPLAEPGGIVVSEPVWHLVRSRPHVSARPLGRHSFKNVAEPVSVYALTTSDAAPAPVPRRKRRTLLAGALGVLALSAALAYANRAAILAWVAIQAPRIFANPIEQQISFAETSDGVRIAYATTGAGPPMIFVLGWATHLTEGLGSPLYDRSGAIAWYSRDHTVVRYDGRGFGLSDRNVEDFSLETRVRDLEAVADALRLERFALYALSSGGPAAVAYAARHPDRVTHLVLAATFLGTPTRRSGDESTVPREMLDLFRSSWDSPVARATAVEWLAPEASEAERRVLMHFLRVTGDGSAVAAFLTSEMDVTEEARRLRLPTLVVAGDADHTVAPGRSRRLASTIPGARFEILQGASHLDACVNDPRLMRLVSEFLGNP